MGYTILANSYLFINYLTAEYQPARYASGMRKTVDSLNELYTDNKTCAKLVGLNYIEDEENGITRIKRGKGFTFKHGNEVVTDKLLKTRIAELVIPPAWTNVWICPSDKGHILVTGTDEKGRKQYIYHPKWRTMRDLIKFYRMIVFATALPKIRKRADKNLKQRGFTKDKVMAAMLWILDNCYIRIGNDTYFHENESVGLTTLTDRNIVIVGPVVTLAFKGKSGKQQQITFEYPQIAKLLDELRQIKGARLFRYKDKDGSWRPVESKDINDYLHEQTKTTISAKDFRTWGGTLIAFLHLMDEEHSEKDKKADKVVTEAVDQAAAVLGNTRAVARSSYIHPHLLEIYGTKDFDKYYSKAFSKQKLSGLDNNESNLLHFLEELFENQFELLKS